MSEQHSLENTLRLFESGFDDVIRKPVHIREILARITAIRRRAQEDASFTEIGAMRVFLDGRDPEIDGEPMPLPRRERRILEYLASNSGRRVTKTQVFNAIYGIFDEDVEENVVESHISQAAQEAARAAGFRPHRFQAFPRLSAGRVRQTCHGASSRPRPEASLAQVRRASLAQRHGIRGEDPMSLYGMMRTGVSGMNAQANRLSTVADNIANAGTTGYKRSSTEFASMVLPSSPGSYNSGGVNTHVRTQVSDAGVLQYTNSSTDLAIDGDGFFVVQDQSGSTFLTRAGAFVPDDEGHLVNAAGYRLMGYSYANGTPTTTANGFGGMEAGDDLARRHGRPGDPRGRVLGQPSRHADAVAAADLPSANGASATYSAKTSLVAYDDLGGQVMLDVYFTKTGANTWEVAVYNRADAAPNTTFPYSSGPVATQTLNFDSSTGHLAAASADSIDIAIPGGQTANVDLSSMSELSSDFSIFNAGVNGNPPSSIEASRSAATAPATRSTPTAPSARSTESRWPPCPAPTISSRSPATSTARAPIPAPCASASPTRAAWAASSPARWRTPTSTWRPN